MKKNITNKRNFESTDDSGNRLSSTVLTGGKILISLLVKGSGKPMYVGYIDLNQSKLVLGRKKEHMVNDAYGIPEYLLQNSRKFSFVEIVDEDESFLIKNSIILSKGMMTAKKVTYTTQRFITLNDLRRFNEYEKERKTIL